MATLSALTMLLAVPVIIRMMLRWRREAAWRPWRTMEAEDVDMLGGGAR